MACDFIILRRCDFRIFEEKRQPPYLNRARGASRPPLSLAESGWFNATPRKHLMPPLADARIAEHDDIDDWRGVPGLPRRRQSHAEHAGARYNT